MVSNYNSYIQPNVGSAESENIFAGNIQPIEVDDSSSFIELYGKLDEDHSAQCKAATHILLRLVDISEKLLPKDKIWLPDQVSSIAREKTFDIDAPGITFIAPQNYNLSLKKDESNRSNIVFPGRIGFILNTSKTPVTHVKQLDNSKKFNQRIFTFSGKIQSI